VALFVNLGYSFCRAAGGYFSRWRRRAIAVHVLALGMVCWRVCADALQSRGSSPFRINWHWWSR